MNRSTPKWRVAVVVQRYGEEVNGGAELHARWLAEHLLPWADVHVVTTCALDYQTWANYYPPGRTILNGVQVHRFAVDAPRDWAAFQRLTAQTVQRQHSVLDELDWMRDQGPVSTPLLNYLQEAYARFDLYIFFTYLYATTFFGLPLVCDKAILVPTAHEEPYLYLSLFRSLFHLPRVIVYNTETEQELVSRVTRNWHQRPGRHFGRALPAEAWHRGGVFALRRPGRPGEKCAGDGGLLSALSPGI
jgi:hypothetical protein